MTGINPAQFIFLDETSSPITLTPLRARAARGQRAVGYVPRGQRPHIAWLATLTSRGLGESLLVRGTIDQRIFAAFVERVLVLNLHPGQIVILDNLAVHKSAAARALIEEAGYDLVFLPPIPRTSTRSSRPSPRASRPCGAGVPVRERPSSQP